jgi:hypothetical protein
VSASPPDPTAGVRTRQCKACPWRRDVDPARDIPVGYTAARHRGLACTIAVPGALRIGALQAAACHESPLGREQPCVGWVVNQLGLGNNLALRIQAMDGRFGDLRTDGPQHAWFEDTLPRAKRGG